MLSRFACGAVSALSLLAGVSLAGEKKLMHCFAFTVIDTASPAEWAAFAKATDALPGKIPGLTKVWHGKLRQNLSVWTVDAEARKKVAAGEKDVPGKVNRVVRQHGVCMELADAAALKTYDAHPAHKEWVDVYSKVRVEGTTTIDILGQ